MNTYIAYSPIVKKDKPIVKEDKYDLSDEGLHYNGLKRFIKESYDNSPIVRDIFDRSLYETSGGRIVPKDLKQASNDATKFLGMFLPRLVNGKYYNGDGYNNWYNRYSDLERAATGALGRELSYISNSTDDHPDNGTVGSALPFISISKGMQGLRAATDYAFASAAANSAIEGTAFANLAKDKTIASLPFVLAPVVAGYAHPYRDDYYNENATENFINNQYNARLQEAYDEAQEYADYFPSEIDY